MLNFHCTTVQLGLRTAKGSIWGQEMFAHWCLSFSYLFLYELFTLVRLTNCSTYDNIKALYNHIRAPVGSTNSNVTSKQYCFKRDSARPGRGARLAVFLFSAYP